MSKNHNTTILHGAPEPPVHLAEKILRSIEKEERKRVFRQITVSSVLLLVSLGVAVASVMDLGIELSRSGFLSFVSLFGSDFSFAIMNLHELFLSLEESFPAVSAAFCIASTAFVLWFGARLVNEAWVIHQNKFVDSMIRT